MAEEFNARDYIRRDELADFLKKHLSLEVTASAGGFTDPNTREIRILFGKEVIARTDINIKDSREYEG